MPVDVEKLSGSSVGVMAIRKALKDADDSLRPEPTIEQLREIADRADALNVFGFDAKQDKDGNWIAQGIGAPGRETANHFQSIRRYEGPAAWEKAVRAMWRDHPLRAKAIGLPELPKA